MIYSNELSVLEARSKYFERSGFNTDTYTDRWVKLPVPGGRFHFYLWNFSARKKAVPFHDIDHVLTEYPTDWKGEFMISAFEIGSGCGNFWAAWGINLQGMAAGAVLFPRDLMRAFARGRRSKGVYGFASHEELLGRRVGELRAELIAPEHGIVVGVGDIARFWAWVSLSVAAHLGPLAGLGWFLFGR